MNHFLSGNKHYLSVHVVVVEPGGYRSSNHFYGLIELGTDTSAAEQFRLIKKFFEDNGTWTKISKNIAALVI